MSVVIQNVARVPAIIHDYGSLTNSNLFQSSGSFRLAVSTGANKAVLGVPDSASIPVSLSGSLFRVTLTLAFTTATTLQPVDLFYGVSFNDGTGLASPISLLAGSSIRSLQVAYNDLRPNRSPIFSGIMIPPGGTNTTFSTIFPSVSFLTNGNDGSAPNPGNLTAFVAASGTSGITLSGNLQWVVEALA